MFVVCPKKINIIYGLTFIIKLYVHILYTKYIILSTEYNIVLTT